MTKLDKEQLKEKIKIDIEALKKQISILMEKTKPISPDCSLGRLTRLEAMGESHVNHKVLDESNLRLVRLKNALSRVEHEVFGICIECQNFIGVGRMQVRPESIRCVECANDMS